MTSRHIKRDATLRLTLVASGVAVVALGMVVKIADSVRESDALVRIDSRIVDFLIRHRTPFLNRVAQIVTQLGSGWVIAPIVVLSVIALLRARHRRGAVVLAMSSAGAALLVAAAKNLVGRPRPPIAEHLVTANGHAFPSGHAAQAVACYGALAWLAWELSGTRRVRLITCIAATSIAFAIGFSRVYLGVHWPSDVLSGWLLGVGWLAALIGASLARPSTPQPDKARRVDHSG